jgi:tetratricopeptide (TPR) repeat protein
MSLQDPEFENFKRAYQEENFNYALHSLKKLLAVYPHSFALRWHHARVLEKLGRFAEARIAVGKVLKLREDFVPALIMQVQLDFYQGSEDDSDHDELDDEETLSEHARFNQIEQRLYKILSIDPDAVDALHMLSGLLRGHEGDAHIAKANQLLNRAINLAPDRVDLLEDRGNSLLGGAIVEEGDTTHSINIVSTFSGMRYKRDQMELALSDFHTCYQLTGEHRFGLRVASILHDLGRFDEALAAYDKVLANVAEDDPYRALIVERRARSENDGAGEREQMAQLLESAIAPVEPGKDRTLEDNNIAHTLMSAADAVRTGTSVDQALEERLSDDREENLATSIAAQIIKVANEPAPDLIEVNPKDFPTYQQKFIAKCKRELLAQGLEHVADAEAQGMRMMLGSRVLLSFYADHAGEIGVVAFCMKPKKPNPLAILFLLMTGKWKTLATLFKVNTLVECVSQFSNGDHLSTQYFSVSPFEYGPPVYIEKLSPKLSIAKLVAHHQERLEEHKLAHPHIEVMHALDLAAIDERWVKAQAAKREYRRKIGYITEPELEQLLGSSYDKFADKVRAKLKVLTADL